MKVVVDIVLMDIVPKQIPRLLENSFGMIFDDFKYKKYTAFN